MSLINQAEVKKLLLSLSRELRRGKFTRVSMSQIVPHFEGIIRDEAEKIVRTHPSIGKTIMLESRKKDPVVGLDATDSST